MTKFFLKKMSYVIFVMFRVKLRNANIQEIRQIKIDLNKPQI